jgi:DNA primase
VSREYAPSVPRIKDSSVRDVVGAADMVEVVSGRTQLRRASGSRYTGRCPFHEERTPSFSVNPVEKLYYCFGCGKGGDVISFVRETENLDFVAAVEWLAERFRVPLEYEETSPRVEAERKHRERLLTLLDQTATYFERLLWDGDTGKPVRDYLASRGLREDVSHEFRLGLAPGHGLVAKAKERGFTPDELRAAGLATVRGGDYFPHRLMFPLCDARGRVLGFQARKLREDDPLRGKYVNSPEGDLFHKGSILYGLHLARTAIAKQDRAAVVEGNTDVIALRQSGYEPVVASMGTALTERQLRELGRLTSKVYLCFDADVAGQEATLRGMELAAGQGFDVRVVTLPPGQDPADAPAGFEDQLEKAESYLLYRVRLELDRAADRQEGFVRAREVLAKADDSPERQEALRLLADRLDLPRETLAGLAPARGKLSGASARETPRLLDAGDRLERDALAACLAHPSLLRGLIELTPQHFDVEVNRRFRAALVAGREDADLTALRAELDARAAAEAIDERTGAELLLRLRERKLKRDLTGADLPRTTELQAHLARVRQALAELT